ncbi:DUF4430 domain-containing protein [Candidatus Pseudothioglobus singularis]|jgi:hypothetical protein|nr:DUF4430 domain-containing protein [Candidatus Pseudothioglobus singularis]
MKLNLKIFTLLLMSLFSILSSVSYADESPDSIQLTLAVTAADRINLTSVKMVEKGLNAYEAIKQLVVVGVKDTSYGPQIMALGGVEAIGNTYWALYVNGSMSMVGAQDVILLDDTFIRLNMEDF